MVGGQALDLDPASTAGREFVEEVHRRKTAALLGAAAEMGALCAAVPDEDVFRARAFGIALGRAFQATDDILDVTGTSESLGKTPGKDERAAKPTLVAALGLEGARVRARELAASARTAAHGLGARSGDPLHELVELVLDRER
jgi:geranylgeranyl pyrophosphate synthase